MTKKRVTQRAQRRSTEGTGDGVKLSAQLFLAPGRENGCRCKGIMGLGAVLAVLISAQKCIVAAQKVE